MAKLQLCVNQAPMSHHFVWTLFWRFSKHIPWGKKKFTWKSSKCSLNITVSSCWSLTDSSSPGIYLFSFVQITLGDTKQSISLSHFLFPSLPLGLKCEQFEPTCALMFSFVVVVLVGMIINISWKYQISCYTQFLTNYRGSNHQCLV